MSRLLEKYSIGMGDRFGRQGQAQLDAVIQARAMGIELVPVWNKSFREHSIIGTTPADTRKEADAAVKAKGFKASYYVDADHISLKNVEGFLDVSDFFTIDVADCIGKATDAEAIEAFVRRHRDLTGSLGIPGIGRQIGISAEALSQTALKFIGAVRQAGQIYRHIASRKGESQFVTEVSMDESDQAQGPAELLLILAALADEGVPVQTIAPKFSGRFNKGVDYVGDVSQFEHEFTEDEAIIEYAKKRFPLPASLKLSIHSGSDKFSIYPAVSKALKTFKAGVHLKTAGTTWLEELAGLAEAGDEGLAIGKEIYAKALDQFAALCAPYATVIDIDRSRLPSPQEVNTWNSAAFVGALRHDQSCPAFNPHLRQLLHVGYKVAADMRERFLKTVDRHEAVIGRAVTTNILDRHIRRVFPAR
jgi:tagaturonate epimerase